MHNNNINNVDIKDINEDQEQKQPPDTLSHKPLEIVEDADTYSIREFLASAHAIRSLTIVTRNNTR